MTDRAKLEADIGRDRRRGVRWVIGSKRSDAYAATIRAH